LKLKKNIEIGAVENVIVSATRRQPKLYT
jgi:hypothetical protein